MNKITVTIDPRVSIILMFIKTDVARFDPIIAERIDIIVSFWRFVASVIRCEDESYFRIVRKKYIEFFRKNPLDNGRRYR